MKRKPDSRAAKTPRKADSLTANAASGAPRHDCLPFARQGPRPYNLHMMNTACMLSGAALPLAAAHPEARSKIIGLVREMTAQMMAGLNAYRNAGVVAQRRSCPVVWQDGSSRLLQIPAPRAGGGIPVLIVPSLINRYDILDLDPEHSFAAYLADRGFAPYILDWGPPGAQERDFSVNDYILRRLYPALHALERPHVVGYCMGGTMAAGAVAALENAGDKVRSLTLLAAPWDFQAGDSTMAMRMNAFLIASTPVMETAGVLPVDWIQALFASIDPLFAFNKFRAFAGMDPDSPEARRFVIVEDWLNDGVDLAAPAARQALQEWYIENQPVNGVWTLGDRLVDAGCIDVPVLVVAAGGDRLVPQPSALAVLQQIAAADSLTPDIGHIGMMASQRAVASVWAPLAAWLEKHRG